MNADDGSPKEVWAYLVDAGGVPLTREEYVVLQPQGEGSYAAPVVGTFTVLDGKEGVAPAEIRFRFSDGHVARGPIPPEAMEQVQWEEEADDEEDGQ